MSSLPGRPAFPKRRSVEEEAGLLPEDLNEQDLVQFTEQPNEAFPADAAPSRQRSPPPQYPASEASSSGATGRPPPSFFSLFTALSDAVAATVLEPSGPYKPVVVDSLLESPPPPPVSAAPAYAPADSVTPGSSSDPAAASRFQDETKRALPQDTKGESSRSKEEDAEPPPAYSEGPSPLKSFTYLMAAAGGASSIITQVQQGGPPINPIGGEFVGRMMGGAGLVMPVAS